MAITYLSDNGLLVIPGAYPQFTVQSAPSGNAVTGVLFLVGESDSGPDFTLESSLGDNAFGPDQLGDVIAKYKSGNLVDAFRGASSASNDPNITGSFQRAILVKTNPSGQATSVLTKVGGGTYGSLSDLSYGKLGNLIYYTITEQTAEAVPTTGPFTYIPPTGAVDMSVRVNGGAILAYTVPTAQLPPAFVAGLQGVSATMAVSGGVDRAILSSIHGTVQVTASANTITLALTAIASWDTIPTVGDTLWIPSGSAFQGGTNKNRGSYVVTAASATSITATKLADFTGGTPGTVTPPESVAPAAVAATTDIKCYSPVIVAVAPAAVLPGVGKSLELNELVTAADRLSNAAYALSATKVTWVSKTGAPKVLNSVSEQTALLTVNRQADSTFEQIAAGGQVAFQLGYAGTTATLTVTSTTLTTSVTGGTGANLSLNLRDFATLGDLAVYVGAQVGYTASVGTTTLGQVAPTALDEVSAIGAGTAFGNPTARVKIDAVKFFQSIQGNSARVQLVFPTTGAVAGLPALVAATTFLAGGTKGATTDAVFNQAIDALEKLRGNFVVPLFSRDASLDVADGLTESTSTYTIANVLAYPKSHVNKMSTRKRRRNRQAWLSIRDTFNNAKNAAANLAAYRCTVTFQDVSDTGANGVVQFQPWMAAVKAAAMQAAGGYRSITHKFVNVSKALQAAKDWSDTSDTDLENALLSGLMPIQNSLSGGWLFVEDQTTYTRDSNFVFNSAQAIYSADTVALTTAQRMEDAFVGQSNADVTASVAAAAFDGIMADMLRLKLIGVSDDAPKGYTGLKISINGSVMRVQASIRLATAIIFIPIDFTVQMVQTAVSQ